MRHRTFQFMQRKMLLRLFRSAFWLCLIGLAFFSNTSCSDVDDYSHSKVPSTDIHYLEIETKDMGTISTVQDMLIAAGLDRLTHHCHIFEMNGESYRSKQSAGKGKNKKKKYN